MARIDAALDGAVAGRGQLIVVEAAAGLGKTALLGSARESARVRGMTALTARASELEREFSFGAVRQLLSPFVHALDELDRERALSGAASLAAPLVHGEDLAPRSAPSADPEFGRLYGLFWLLANLAERQPLLLSLDDLHWSDAASLRFLEFIAPRLDELAIAVVAAVRPREPGPHSDLTARLATQAEVISLRPLSVESAGALLEEGLGSHVDSAFATGCHRITAGNPLFLDELIGELRRQGIEPVEAAVGRVEQLGPPSISQIVLVRVARLGEAAVSFAQSAAVLGDAAEYRHAARLAGLDEEQAREAADALARVSILSPGDAVSFVHPIVRQAIYDDLAPRERAKRHRSAWQLLDSADAARERVAAHMLLTDPAADARVADALRAAGNDALAQGAPAAAAEYLRRAVAEPPATGSRGEALADLGHAETLLGAQEAAIEALRQALAFTDDPAGRGAIALKLGQVLVHSNRGADALEVFDDAIAELGESGEREVVLWLVAAAIGAAMMTEDWRPTASRHDSLRHRLMRDRSDAVTLSCMSIEAAAAGDSADRAADLAEAALDQGLLDTVSSDSQQFSQAFTALFLADRLERATATLDEGLHDARRRGSAAGFAAMSCFRAQVSYRRGLLADAEADLTAALEMERLSGIELVAVFARAFLVDVLIEKGELDEATETLEEGGLAGDLPPVTILNHVLDSRGRLWLARRDPERALSDFRESGRRHAAAGISNPAWLPWRSQAATAFAAMGDVESAGPLLDEELELAERWGAPRAIGIALQAAGNIAGGDPGLELLERAVSVLDRSPARLTLAHAMTDLGAALRRANRRAEARDPLARGLDLADRCGAHALGIRAREELAASGARPRRRRLSGLDSLTPSELRVAQHAAQGMSNPEIAQALFVTRKTIETHLGSIYRKLEISSRAELPTALAGAAGDAPEA